MNRKLILILVLFTSVYLGRGFFSGSDDEIIDPPTSSIKEVAYKAKRRNSSNARINQLIPPSPELAGQPIDYSEIEKIKFQKQKKKYYTKFTLNQMDFLKVLPSLEAEHERIKTMSRELKLPLDDVDYLSPAMIYYLATFFGLKVSQITSQDIESLGISTDEWLYISNFVSSKDFMILLGQDRIGTESTSPSSLKETYISIDQMKNEEIHNDIP